MKLFVRVIVWVAVSLRVHWTAMGASLGDIALGLSALGLVRGPGVGLVGDLSAGVTNLSARLDGINYLNLFNGKKKKKSVPTKEKDGVVTQVSGFFNTPKTMYCFCSICHIRIQSRKSWL